MACLAGSFLVLAPHRRLELVAGLDQLASSATGCVRVLPEVASNVLPTGLHIGDCAAAVSNQGREPGLAVASGAAERG